VSLEIDQATIVVGLPKHGKSTIARREALQWLETYPTGIVLAHDKHGELAGDICAPYRSVDDWRKAHAAEQAPGGASFRCASSDVIKLAIELGERFNAAKDVRLPMKVMIEESSLANTSGPTHMDSIDVEMFSNRRHYGIAPYYNVQRQSALMRAFYEQATDVYIFAQTARNARELEDKLSLPEGALDATITEPPLRVCPKYRCLHWRQGEGLVDGW
jgi:hypothetical protein